jgi:hypothetical protein
MLALTPPGSRSGTPSRGTPFALKIETTSTLIDLRHEADLHSLFISKGLRPLQVQGI